jgi:hypothetical protein
MLSNPPNAVRHRPRGYSSQVGYRQLDMGNRQSSEYPEKLAESQPSEHALLDGITGETLIHIVLLAFGITAGC